MRFIMLKKINILVGIIFVVIGILLIKVEVFPENLDSDNYVIKDDVIFSKKNSIKYLAILYIPKICLEKGILSRNSVLNNVDRNIYTVKYESPLKDDSTIVLASHSGTSKVSYFRYLDDLVIGDDVYLKTTNGKYLYRIEKKHVVKKTGQIFISDNQKQLILTTCSMKFKNKQLVVVARYVKKFLS